MCERALRQGIPLPGIRLRLRYHALHGDSRVTAWLLGRPAAVVRGNSHGLPAGVQELFVRVESVTSCWFAWAAHPIAVEPPGLETRHEDVPGGVRAMPSEIEANDMGWLCLMYVIEQQQFLQGGALGEDAAVDSLRVQGRTERKTSPVLDGCIAHHGSLSLPVW
jgi:hypothetical protein